MEKIILIGCGGHARSVADVILYNSPTQDIIFVEENAKDHETIMGFPVLKTYDMSNSCHHCASGDNIIRKQYPGALTIVSQRAYISPHASYANGVFIGHGAHIGPMVTIGYATIINTHAIVEHECTIGNYSHISIHASLAGKVSIGSNVFVGAGAVIIDKVTICDDVIIGAGAVVTQNINEKGVYTGIPARRIK